MIKICDPLKKTSQIYRPKCAWNTVNTTVFVENIGFFGGAPYIYIYTYIYIHMKNRNPKFLRDGLARRSTKRSTLSCHMSLVSFKVLDKWIGPAKWTSRRKWKRAKCWWSLWPDLWHKIQEDSTGRPRSIWSDSHKSDLVLCSCHSDGFHGHHITKSTNYVSHF